MNDIVVNKIQSIHRCIMAVVEAIIKADLNDLVLFGDAVIEFLDR